MKTDNKPKLSQIRKENEKNVRNTSQFSHLEFRKGVLHQIYEIQGSKDHQLVLPTVYRAQALQLLHDEQGTKGQSIQWLS